MAPDQEIGRLDRLLLKLQRDRAKTYATLQNINNVEIVPGVDLIDVVPPGPCPRTGPQAPSVTTRPDVQKSRPANAAARQPNKRVRFG